MVDAFDQLREENSWPRSYNLYSGQLTFQIAAHSEEQALRRLKQLEQFLEGLLHDPIAGSEFPHDSVRYVVPHPVNNLGGVDYNISLQKTVTVESLDELRPSMGSGEIPEWSWLLPNADADYDPDQAAHRVHASTYDETEWE